MAPYASFLYFGILLYVAIPVVALRLAGRLPRWAILAATAAMLALQYSSSTSLPGGWRDAWVVAAWAGYQWALVRGVLRTASPRPNRIVYRAALVLALAPLAAAKLGLPVGPLAFLGLSYVTFRALDALIAVGDGLVTAVPLTEYAAYVLFFPAISAGPIDRFRRFGEDWRRVDSRAAALDDVDVAVHKLFTGFLYKFILAALVKTYWMDPAGAATGAIATLSFMYAYSAYLFFDFAGYSLFAIGVGRLFGVRTPENFDRPFLARNIREFWDRWHISLSWWFRDHVYMRVVLAATKRKWFKSRFTASYLGFCVSFGLMGLWHGTAVHYLVYGVYHAGLLIAHDLYKRRQPRRALTTGWTVGRVGAILLTAHAVMFGFLIFSGHLSVGR